MAHFFIDRPIFAWVLAIMTMALGIFAGVNLPVAQYPQIAPPEVRVMAVYPGANAETVEESVTQVIEQSLTGLDGFRYMSSQSSSTGVVSIAITFEQGTDPDMAQVQVQNKIQTALTQLPQAVQQQGIQVQKSSSSFLMVVGFYSPDGSLTHADLGDYVASNISEPLSRLYGIGETQLFGSGYAMNIWLDPMKLNQYGMTSLDVVAAIKEQNTQATLGDLGAMPAKKEQVLRYTINAQSLLETEAEFKAIQLRVNEDGSKVLLDDVARVELSPENEQFSSHYNGKPATAMAINLASGANALDTAKAVREFLETASLNFPEGMEYMYPYDTTPFVEVSINNVMGTLIEAIILVFIVMYVFLRSFRAALIPLLAIPYVLCGTLAILAAMGFILNTLTLFAMVLAIGLLVDDAIVVVENVERIMEEEDATPYEAAKKTMDQIVGALVGIGVVLSAVFVPMAFMPGATGIIYRQFSVTIITAMLLSVLVAIIFTPSLCATILKSKEDQAKEPTGLLKIWLTLVAPITKVIHLLVDGFNRLFDRGNVAYEKGVRGAVTRPKRFVMGLLIVLVGVGFLFKTIPTSFLPEEDQGFALGQIINPSNASLNVTEEALASLTQYILEEESENVQSIMTVAGFSFTGRGSDQALYFLMMKPWDERKEPIQATLGRVNQHLMGFALKHNAFGFAFIPPAIPELGVSTGVEFYLQDSIGLGHEELLKAVNMLKQEISQSPTFNAQTLRDGSMMDKAEYYIDIDRDRARALQVPIDMINQSLSVAWGGMYVNDFVDRGRIKKVQVQGDAEFRMMPSDFNRWYVRNTKGEMVPFSAFASGKWSSGSPQIDRFNGNPAFKLSVEANQGRSTGEAMLEIERLVRDKLPQGIDVAWSGTSYEERQTGDIQAVLFAVSVFVIFLSLAALYESWSIPIAVLLTIPVGIIGAVLTAHLGKGLDNDVYFQVGMLTTIGLTAKNAILIVEFARDIMREGKDVITATVEAAHLRLRPIMMTSIAFGLGVVPLALASGAGSGAQNVVGKTVVGGMIAGTFLVIFYAPVFFRLIVGKRTKV